MSIKKLLLICACAAILSPSLSAEPKEPTSTADDMQLKLEYAKTILDGLVTEDFDKIRKGADSLNKFGKRKWLENEFASYRTQNQVFWFTTGTLLDAAENKNIDAATLSYTQMMHSCVNCHKLIRHQ